ncbi:hypothetical protein [Terrimonas sp.]|uniref:hypothetical protein n=1 Tax=Terrimonas sp. TaxID=1914338 RepID=UPI00105714A9|nr:hypothetical protein [Terrimonas sp.]
MTANGFGLAMWQYSVIRLPVTDAKFIAKCSLFILLPGIIRRLELKLGFTAEVYSVSHAIANAPVIGVPFVTSIILHHLFVQPVKW